MDATEINRDLKLIKKLCYKIYLFLFNLKKIFIYIYMMILRDTFGKLINCFKIIAIFDRLLSVNIK